MQSLDDHVPIEAAEPSELDELDQTVEEYVGWLFEMGRYEPLDIVESLIRIYQLKVKLITKD